ncbi:MAG: 50S ribosomal protein L5 [Candidatus Dojkabacteria bacterium]|nr:50S ribosomal protein L5 [Candidatus Dojkabacteria bacterium]
MNDNASLKPSLQQKYLTEVVTALMKEFGITNIMQVPKIVKVVVNAGIGKEYSSNPSVVDEYSKVLAIITGQKPVVIKSKVSVANFKLKAGTPNGLKVTLRRERMWSFLDKLINVALPRIKDFRGVSRNSFDKLGRSYTLGIKEHIIFPEIDTSVYSKIRSLQIVIVTNSKNKKQTERLLEVLGMPFKRSKK